MLRNKAVDKNDGTKNIIILLYTKAKNISFTEGIKQLFLIF